MIETELRLDITRLEKVRRAGEKITARCPACHAAGNDRTGDHLAILPSGKFACAAFPGDGQHRREIFRLVGVIGERKWDPQRERRWRMERDEEKRRESAERSLVESAKSKRDPIVARHPWEPADVWESSPQRIDCPLVETDPRHFISSLFPQGVSVWAGETTHSGVRYANHWRTVRDWENEPSIGPMTSPAIWNPGAMNRTAANVLSSPYVVLDFDGFDGVSPVTREELARHVSASLAIVRWIREGLHWQLAAIVWTGNKSIHCWFHSPPVATLQSLKMAATALGIDPGLIGRPEHPCRLPGQRHMKTGEMSRVLWLQNHTEHK